MGHFCYLDIVNVDSIFLLFLYYSGKQLSSIFFTYILHYHSNLNYLFKDTKDVAGIGVAKKGNIINLLADFAFN